MEVGPFVNATDVKVGQNGSGSYIEFYVPKSMVLEAPLGYLGGNATARRIFTDGLPLDLTGSKPRFIKYNFFRP